jgi:hypothetical protein
MELVMPDKAFKWLCAMLTLMCQHSVLLAQWSCAAVRHTYNKLIKNDLSVKYSLLI